MRVMFFIDPLIELGRPSFKDAWIHRINKITNAFFLHDINSTTYLMVGDGLLKYIKDKLDSRINVISINSSIFTKYGNYLELTKKWHMNTFSPEELGNYSAEFREFIPQGLDLVLSTAPIPYLQPFLSNTKILFFEYGFLSRLPFPETYYFDLIGMGGGQYLNKYWEAIEKEINISDTCNQLLDRFCENVRLVENNNPFSIIQKYKLRFKKLILLPLQFSQFYLFDSYANYVNQFDFLMDVLQQLDKYEVGVVVVCHPDYAILSDEQVNFLKEKYNHFIYERWFDNYYSTSLFVMPYVDAVLTVSSAVAFLTLIWEIPLVCFHPECFSSFADAIGINNLENAFNAGVQNKSKKRKILYWLLTYFYFPETYLNCNELFINYIFNIINNKDQTRAYTFFQKPEITLEYYCSQIFQNFQENKFPLCKLNKISLSECFADYGDGFKQEDAIQRSFSDASEIVFDISKFDPIQQLRFDPSAIPGQVKLAGAKLVDEQNQEIKLTITSHNANWTDGLYYNFYHDDPQFIFDVPDTNNAYEKFVVEFTVSPFDVHQISEHVNWATRRINEVEQLILQQQTKIDELAKRLEQKELLLAEKVSTLNMVNEKIVKLSHDLENTSNLYQEKNILLELANKQVAELSIERESLSFRIEDEYQELQLVLATILENQPVQDNVTDKLLFHREQINAKLILLHEKLTASSGEIQRLNCIIQEQMHKAVASLQDELIIQREKNIALNQQITQLLTSVSWKITKPLRKLSNLLKSFSVDKR